MEAMGNLAGAKEMYTQALAIREKELGSSGARELGKNILILL